MRSNLPERSELWWKLLSTNSEEPHVAQRTIPGGLDVCDRVMAELPEVSLCALVDYRAQRIVGYPTGQMPPRERERELVTTALELLQSSPHSSDDEAERVEEIVVCGRDGWGAVYRLPFGTLALVVAVASQTPWVLARQVFIDAIEGLERQRNLVVENVAT